MRIISTAAAVLFLLAPASVALAQTAASPDPGTKGMQQSEAGQTQQPKHKMHRKSARHKKPLHHSTAMRHKAKPHKTTLSSKGAAHKAKGKAKATAKQAKPASTY